MPDTSPRWRVEKPTSAETVSANYATIIDGVLVLHDQPLSPMSSLVKAFNAQAWVRVTPA